MPIFTTGDRILQDIISLSDMRVFVHRVVSSSRHTASIYRATSFTENSH